MNAPSPLPDQAGLPPDEVRRSWRLVTIAGGLGAMNLACIGGAPFTRFLKDSGFEPHHFTVIASLGALAVFFQGLSGALANRIARRKALFIGMMLVNRVLMLAVLAGPSLFLDKPLRIAWILAVLFVMNSLNHCGHPLWMSWMADLLPDESLSRHWGSRNRHVTFVQIAMSLGIASAFYFLDDDRKFMQGFMILAVSGVVVGILDILLFIRVPEPKIERSKETNVLKSLWEPFKDEQYRPFLNFMCVWKIAIAFSLPLVQIFLMDGHNFSVTRVQIMLTFSALGVVLASRFWGLLTDTYGHRSAIRLAIVGRSVLLLSFIVCPPVPAIAFPVFGLAIFCDGLASAGVQISFQTARVQLAPRANRSTYIGTINVVSMGLAGGFGALCATAILKMFKDVEIAVGAYRLGAFHAAFGVSALVRVWAWVLSGRIGRTTDLPLSAALCHAFRANPAQVVRATFQLGDSKHASVRSAAAERLGELRSPLAIRELIRALQDSDMRVRESAADALGKIGMAEASGPLAQSLNDPGSGIHARAARALGQIGCQDSLKALLKNLTLREPLALRATVNALARIGDAAAILPLICLFEEVQDKRSRQRIAEALGQLCGGGTPKDVLVLLEGESSMTGRSLRR